VMNYAKKKHFKEVRLKTQSEQNGHQRKTNQCRSFRLEGEKKEELFDRVLVAGLVARESDNLGLETPKLRSTKKTSFR